MKIKLNLGFVFVVALLAAIGLVRALNLEEQMIALLEWIRSSGYWGVSVFILLTVVFPLTFLPVIPLVVAAGVIYGFLFGCLWVTLGVTLSAVITFLIGRYFLRNKARTYIENKPKLKKLDHLIHKEDWKVISLIRLSSVFPFAPTNYFLGSTKVKFWRYFLISFVSMLPGTLIYVYSGTLLEQVSKLGVESEQVQKTKATMLVFAIIALITLAAVLFRMTRKLFEKEIEEEGRG